MCGINFTLNKKREEILTIFLYQGETYCLFLSEYEIPITETIEKDTQKQEEYFKELNGKEKIEQRQISLKIEDYRLFLEKKCDNFSTQEIVKYSGGVLIAKGLLEEYKEYEDLFSYETVLELIFKNGCLITTIDHSKAMLRIRKNLEQGLRSLVKTRDRICIQRFLNRTMICDYRQSMYAYAKKKVFRNLYRGIETVKRKVIKRQKE